MVDPIDGTANFVCKSDQWAVSIGLFADDGPVFGVTHAPVRNSTFIGGAHFRPTINGVDLTSLRRFVPSMGLVDLAFHPTIPVPDRLERLSLIMDDMKLDMRISGAATISLMQVAAGQVDDYIASGISNWDIMAMLAVLEALGAKSNVKWQHPGCLPSSSSFAGHPISSRISRPASSRERDDLASCG